MLQFYTTMINMILCVLVSRLHCIGVNSEMNIYRFSDSGSDNKCVPPYLNYNVWSHRIYAGIVQWIIGSCMCMYERNHIRTYNIKGMFQSIQNICAQSVWVCEPDCYERIHKIRFFASRAMHIYNQVQQPPWIDKAAFRPSGYRVFRCDSAER